MKIELSHIENLLNDEKDIHLYVSTEDEGYYLEKKLNIKDNQFLVVHVRVKKTGKHFSCIHIDGTIHDSQGEITDIPLDEKEMEKIVNWIVKRISLSEMTIVEKMKQED